MTRQPLPMDECDPVKMSDFLVAEGVLRTQLDWRGTNDRKQGNIVLQRGQAEELLAELKRLRAEIELVSK